MALRLRMNVKLLHHPAGSIVEVPTDADGVPSDLFWRRRLRDSARDGCVSIVQDEPAPSEPITEGPVEEPAAKRKG